MAKQEFQKEKFLLSMLACIFLVQASVFVYGFTKCMNSGGIKNCPEVGRRYDQTFGLMVATTLALLTGSQLVKNGKDEEPKEGSSARVSPTKKDLN